MRPRFAVLFGLCTAEYLSIEFLNMLNIIPSNGVVYHYLPSMRPLELMWLESLQEVNPAIVDVDIAKMITQNSASSRIIRKYHAAHGGQRALIDYTYVFAMQVIYKDSAPVESDITGFFDTAQLKDSADWTSIMNAHTINFQSPGMLHGTCKSAESECRDVTVKSDFCYDTHVIPFDSDVQAQFDERAANVTALFSSAMTAAMSGMEEYVSSTTTVSSIVPNFPDASTESQNVEVGAEGDAFFAVWDFVKTTTENVHTVCMKVDSSMSETFGNVVKSDQGWMNSVGDFIGTLTSNSMNSQTVEYDYTCVAPSCDPSKPPTTMSTTTITTTTTPTGDDKCEDVICPDGSECSEGECIDINECASPELNWCQSFETCVNDALSYSCNFNYLEHCPAQKYPVEWKGAKYMRVIFESQSESVVTLNVLKRYGFDIRRNSYVGFTVFSRKHCGSDFLKALVDGRLSVGFLDATNLYTPVGRFWRDQGGKSSAGLSYRLTKVVQNDLPFKYNRKEDKYIKNMKKDTVMLVFSGLESITWKTDMRGCITKGANGVLPDDTYPETLTACVTKDKTFY